MHCIYRAENSCKHVEKTMAIVVVIYNKRENGAMRERERERASKWIHMHVAQRCEYQMHLTNMSEWIEDLVQIFVLNMNKSKGKLGAKNTHYC